MSKFWLRAVRVFAALAVACSAVVMQPPAAQAAAAEVETRRLAGESRYETAAEIAEEYADRVGGSTDGRAVGIDTVIVVSGDDRHAGYAVAAPALARLHEAPVLLTPSDRLHYTVTAFLTRHAVSTVIIIGGQQVVSRQVERSMSAISGLEVMRISGEGPIGTAVAVAEHSATAVGHFGEFPVMGRTALLAGSDAVADALAAGPLAYQGRHPILLTGASVLDEGVARLLEESQTEHVVILGGIAAVSAGVERAAEQLGVAVTRWAGADRVGTATEVAERLLSIDSPHRCFDGAEIAVADGWRWVDAITAAPLLGELCAPLLLSASGRLPSAAGRLIGSELLVGGNADGMLRITALGGTSAVADRVLEDGARLARLQRLGAQIVAVEGGCHFSVIFDEPVMTADASDIANYLDGNAPFDAADGAVDAGSGQTTSRATLTLSGAQMARGVGGSGGVGDGLGGGGGAGGAGVPVPAGCDSPLQYRDRIGVVGDAIRVAGDRRTVERVEYFVPADSDAPALRLSAVHGAGRVWVSADEPLGASTATVVFGRRGQPDAEVDVEVTAGVSSFWVALPGALDGALVLHDVVRVAAGEVSDLAGNPNEPATAVVGRDRVAPQVRRIVVTTPVAAAQASVTLAAGDGQGGQEPGLTVTADADGAADGAGGNSWRIEVVERSRRPRQWTSTQTVAADVSVANRRVVVFVLAELATVDDAVTELNAYRPFADVFTAAAVSGGGGAVLADFDGRMRFSGGASTVDLTVLWSEPVRACDAADMAVDPRRIEIDVDRSGDWDFALDGYAASDSDITFVGDDNADSPLRAGTAACDADTTAGGTGTLVARVQSADLGHLPHARSIATVRSGAATDLAGNRSAHQSPVRLTSAQ